MSSSAFIEPGVEQPAVAWLDTLGRLVTHGLAITPGELGTVRKWY